MCYFPDEMVCWISCFELFNAKILSEIQLTARYSWQFGPKTAWCVETEESWDSQHITRGGGSLLLTGFVSVATEGGRLCTKQKIQNTKTNNKIQNTKKNKNGSLKIKFTNWRLKIQDTYNSWLSIHCFEIKLLRWVISWVSHGLALIVNVYRVLS